MKKDWMQRFASFVRDNRRKMGYSQAQLAQVTGMNTSYISRLESGDNFQSIKIDFFVKLVDSFEMKDDEVMKLVGLRD
jgi:transcriptional regulator with XRE-family HTH domain